MDAHHRRNCILASSTPYMTASVEGLLRFFDEKPEWSEGHATGVVGAVGEDLSTGCFMHYLESSGCSAIVLPRQDSSQPYPVTTGKQKGPRLDRWIQVDCQSGRTVFQTEIKNWSAHSLSGEVLPFRATPEEVALHKQERWDRRWDGSKLQATPAVKVLIRMKPPPGIDPKGVRPLLIFWEPIGPRDLSGDHLFSIPLPRASERSGGFPTLWVFSVSSNLRSIQSTHIELHVPDAAHRLRILSKLFSFGTRNQREAIEGVAVRACN